MRRVVTFAFGPQVCGLLAEGARREWLLTDGMGGYAMGTASGLRTRRYHGLLVIAGAEPAHRMMALAAADPVITLPGGGVVRLGVHEWVSGAIEPRGHTLLSSFRLHDGVPTWRWRAGEVVLERTVAMRRGWPGVVIRHTQLAGPPIRLAVEPLCTWRDAHGERHASAGLRVTSTGDGFAVEDAYQVTGDGFEPDGEWYLGAHHREEAARGLAASEDLYRAGRFNADLEPGRSHVVCAYAGRDSMAGAAERSPQVIDLAAQRARELTAAAATEAEATLRLAADAFVIRTQRGTDVVAGYPWFGAWSRDTMISYPGLFLATGRVEEGRDLLLGYAETLSEGMLANTADTGRI
ncbi:MAG TPA: glycogen debranching enzyme N-terminal domain-containing protein, partial [Micromonosporaceae bacterium]|nr:glycogen debranching enzyme N-terminal domain-containing protein [Micromonosporaceae bacterium]